MAVERQLHVIISIIFLSISFLHSSDRERAIAEPRAAEETQKVLFQAPGRRSLADLVIGHGPLPCAAPHGDE
jgi:hypothetical protein